jgi:hypothetical protein
MMMPTNWRTPLQVTSLSSLKVRLMRAGLPLLRSLAVKPLGQSFRNSPKQSSTGSV